MLGDSRAERGAYRRRFSFQPPHVAVEDGDELHRRSRDDGGRSAAAREHGDLAEDIAGAKGSYHDAVLEDVSSAGCDRKHGVPEVTLLEERRSGVDLDLRAGAGHDVSLIQGELGEEREPGQLCGIHAGDATTGFRGAGYPSGGDLVTWVRPQQLSTPEPEPVP